MRRSISGPVVIIGIGVMFLLNNFYPEIFQWSQLFRYWPFLLIALGAVRLLEVLLDAGSARPLPPSSMSGGGIALLVLLCLLFWGASKHYRPWHGFPAFVFQDNGVQIFGEEHDFDVNQTLSANATDSRFVLQGLRGNITVSGDESTTVTVTGHRTVRAYNNRTAEDVNRRIKLELVRSGNDLVLRSTGNTSSEGSEVRVTYDVDIKVPRRLNLSAEGATENLTAEAIDGNVEISGEAGSVRLTSIGGNARVETTRRKDLVRAVGIKGNLELRGTGTDLQVEDVTGQVTVQGSYFGTLDFRNLAKPLHFESDQTDLRVEKLPGSINMDLGDFRATDVVGPLHLRCQSRDIHVTDFTDEVEVSVDRGDVELRPKGTLAKMDVHVRAGDIEVALPEKAKFDLHASTASGEVGNEYGDGIEQNAEGRSASGKSTTPGGPRVTLTTDRGNITLKKL